MSFNICQSDRVLVNKDGFSFEDALYLWISQAQRFYFFSGKENPVHDFRYFVCKGGDAMLKWESSNFILGVFQNGFSALVVQFIKFDGVGESVPCQIHRKHDIFPYPCRANDKQGGCTIVQVV